MGNTVNGHTQLLALFGSPVGHSLSPAMYNLSFEKMGVDMIYVCIDAKEEDMEECFRAVRKFNMVGGNITMPGKTVSVKYMDELTPQAELIGAVNTFLYKNGRLIGHNTDGNGFLRGIREAGVDYAGKKMVIFGAGGAATSIQCSAALNGAGEISIMKRKNASFARTVQMAEKIRSRCPECTVNVYDMDDTERVAEEIQSADILVNGTSVGMAPMEDQSIVKDPAMFHPGLVVCDIVYNPVVTKLMREAQAAGCKVIGGKGMLLWQGVEAFKMFTGLDMPVEEVRQAYFPETLQWSEKNMTEKCMDNKDIFLVGFMGAGKSTVAGCLSQKLQANRIEMDEEIVRRAGMPINDIFAKQGEKTFRDMETQLITDMKDMGRCVVSCGGGAVIRPQNVETMKKLGRIVYLTAKPETILSRVKDSTDRPLLNGHMNVEYITQMMEAREPRYAAAADFTVSTDGRTAEEIAAEILSKM